MTTKADNLARYCIETLDFSKLQSSDDDYFCIPLCVVDSVFSIGVKYESVLNVIANTCSYFSIDRKSKEDSSTFTTTKFLEQTATFDPDFLAESVFKNRQRTSARNGILKAAAVMSFLKELQKYGVEHLSSAIASKRRT